MASTLTTFVAVALPQPFVTVYDIVVVPEDMPVTTPVELIVATAGDDEDQDPAAQLAMVTDEPAQTEEGPEMAPASGKGFTITATVASYGVRGAHRRACSN